VQQAIRKALSIGANDAILVSRSSFVWFRCLSYLLVLAEVIKKEIMI
jgi:electron transfer flavoprotein alpha/beta subunit